MAKYAIIEKGVCTNVVESTTPLDGISNTLVPTGYGIGDTYSNGVWSKAKSTLPTPDPTTHQPNIGDLIDENKLLKAQLQAQTERSDFIEDCIAEMATVVYGGV